MNLFDEYQIMKKSFKTAVYISEGLGNCNMNEGPVSLPSRNEAVKMTFYLGKCASERLIEIIDSESKQLSNLLFWTDKKIIEEAEILIEARMETESPGAVDNDNITLEEEVNMAARALKISTMANMPYNLILSGLLEDGKLNIKSRMNLPRRFHPSLDFMPESEIPLFSFPWRLPTGEHLGKFDEGLLYPTTHTLAIWPVILRACHTVYQDSSLRRLRHSINVYLMAQEEGLIDIRLPLFVRALEGLTDPKNGKQLVSRTKRWWPAPVLSMFKEEDDEKHLQDIWNFRSDCIHMKLAHRNMSENVQLQLSYECEVITRIAFIEVLLNKEVLNEIRGYWPEDEPGRIDLNQEGDSN